MTNLKNFLITLCVAGSIALPAAAQSPAEENKEEGGTSNVIERIVTESQGNVSIDIPANIMQQILKEEHQTVRNTAPVLRPGINKISGFRIQVFSDGHNQHSLESRARARGSAVVSKFPKYRGQVYSYSSSPNWYTRIGNFRTQAEAAAALAELKRAFPQFSSEMRIVKSQIVVIK